MNDVFLIIWRFEVAPEHRAEFERRYRAAGDWARLFARSPDWRGTELLRAGDAYLTIDRWESAEAWERFRQEHATDYEDLDRKCEGLTTREEKIAFGVTL